MTSLIVSCARNELPAYGSIPHRVAVKPRKKLEMPPFWMVARSTVVVAVARVLYAAREAEDVSSRGGAEGSGGCS
jgi:hypothetical protein